MKLSAAEKKRRKAFRQEIIAWAISFGVLASMYIALEFGIFDGRMLIIPTAYLLGSIVLLICGGAK